MKRGERSTYEGLRNNTFTMRLDVEPDSRFSAGACFLLLVHLVQGIGITAARSDSDLRFYVLNPLSTNRYKPNPVCLISTPPPKLKPTTMNARAHAVHSDW